MLDKRILYVAGLPRSGSTLLCQLLSLHPMVYSTGHSSPLLPALRQLRTSLSDNEFLLAQLDVDFDRGYQRLFNAFRGFVDGWFREAEEPWVVDKNRGWLTQVDVVDQLDPDFRMLVCVREPGQIYGSIEERHHKTILLDFPDHIGGLSRHDRAARLFAADGVVGGPLHAIEGLRDEPELIQRKLYYVAFEHLMTEPQRVMGDIYRWLGLPASPFDPDALPVRPHESDSYYRFKYPHATHARLAPPRRHAVPSRIERDIRQEYDWFYKIFYPGSS